MGAVRKPLPTESNTLLKPAEEYSHCNKASRVMRLTNQSISGKKKFLKIKWTFSMTMTVSLMLQKKMVCLCQKNG